MKLILPTSPFGLSFSILIHIVTDIAGCLRRCVECSCLSRTVLLPEVIEILSHLTPEALKALQKPHVAIVELQKALASSDSRIAKLDKALTASKTSNAGVDNALASARAQIAILEDRLSTANSSKARLQAEWQTSRKQKQQLCKLLAEKERTVTEQQIKLEQPKSTEVLLMYNERQDALLLCDEIRSKYMDSLSKISLLQTLNAAASSTSTRLRNEKNAAEEKLVVATAESDCMKHKIQAASMRLAEIQLQHPIVEVGEHSVHNCIGV